MPLPAFTKTFDVMELKVETKLQKFQNSVSKTGEERLFGHSKKTTHIHQSHEDE